MTTETAVTMAGAEREAQLQVALNAALARNAAHERTIARLREQLDQAKAAPGPAGETRVFSGYDDDYGIPLFVYLADAKAYAEMDREARYSEDGDGPVGWVEREARTEHVGYPDMWDMDGGNYVVHGIRVHPDLASALAERPIERREPEGEPEPQIEGQTEIALAGTEADR